MGARFRGDGIFGIQWTRIVSVLTGTRGVALSGTV